MSRWRASEDDDGEPPPPRSRKLCVACGQHPAGFRKGPGRSRFVSDKSHELCRRCFAELRESARQAARAKGR